jgi:hypothetical protein
VGVGIPSSVRSGSSALRGELGASRNLWIVCVAPLRLGGLRGKKSTPSIGWEVPVKSRRSAAGVARSARDVIQSGRSGNGTLSSFCMVECIRTYAWICLFNGKVK